MKKYIFKAMAAAALLAAVGCTDSLETTSPSVVDKDFVFSNEESARNALYYGYQTLHNNQSLHSVGFFWTPIWGSDIEDAQDTYSEGSAGCQEKTFYPSGTDKYNINAGEGTEVFGMLYSTIAVCNSLINAFEEKDDFAQIMSGEPNAMSDIYGQAVALRATCYWELFRWYGDVPHALKTGEAAEGLTSRFAIMDYHIQKLREVEPHMYRVGEGNHRADVMNRTYVQGLIGRMCLYNGGYTTRRTDLGADFYVDGNGKVLSFEDWSVEKNHAIYGRRADWRDWFNIAKQYLQAAVDNHGSIQLHLTDPRAKGSAGQEYGNPFQYTFAQMHCGVSDILADESVYEIPMEFNNGGQRPAYIGRPSRGGNGDAPCVGCGQDRVQAWFYYGAYDPNDMRRDALATVTGSDGQGHEEIQSFNRSDWGRGCGPATNKWDWNRLQAPNTLSYGTSGINVSYMRISDIYLMLAEVCAALGDDANGRKYLAIVHNRNFRGGVDPNFDQFITKCGSVYDAVIMDRAFEFLGEGVRRFDLIRTGKLPKACVDDRKIMTEIVEGVEKNGYYTFDNGNQLPAYVWTKQVDGRALYGYRLTAQTPAGKEDDPVLYPGWRGQHDGWGSVIAKVAGVNETNTAIKGLFKYIAPGSAEAQALEADGYVQTNWAVDMPAYKDSYATKLLAGYSDADYAAKNPPIYLLPFTYNTLTTSGITNGYGFRQEQ